jgi:hypothetical protein
MPAGRRLRIISLRRRPCATAGVSNAVAQFFATFSWWKSYSPALKASSAMVLSR